MRATDAKTRREFVDRFPCLLPSEREKTLSAARRKYFFPASADTGVVKLREECDEKRADAQRGGGQLDGFGAIYHRPVFDLLEKNLKRDSEEAGRGRSSSEQAVTFSTDAKGCDVDFCRAVSENLPRVGKLRRRRTKRGREEAKEGTGGGGGATKRGEGGWVLEVTVDGTPVGTVPSHIRAHAAWPTLVGSSESDEESAVATVVAMVKVKGGGGGGGGDCWQCDVAVARPADPASCCW